MRGHRTSKSMSQSDISHNMEESQQQISFDSTHSGTFGGATKASDKSKNKRKPKGCKCRGDCGNQRCGCNSLDQKCTIKCGCTDKCRNRDVTPANDNSEEDGIKIENVSHKTESESSSDHDENHEKSPNKTNETIETNPYLTTKSTLNATSYLTPKMAR